MSEGGPTRSGEMATEVLYVYEDQETGERGAKMPWAPLHPRKEYFANQGDVPGVRVRMASHAAPSEIVVREFSTTASFGEMGEAYPGFVPLPGRGPWRMIATSGPDWGCFDLRPS